MFSDLNTHAIRPTKSLGILYDHRDPLSQLARQLSDDVPVFRDLTETEKSTISNRSRKLFTLSSIFLATKRLLGKGAKPQVSIEEARLARDFWTEVSKNMPAWQKAAQDKVSSAELRRDCIHAHGVALQALAIAGSALLQSSPTRWKQKLRGLLKLDWSRANRELWEGRATVGGRVSKASTNVILTANLIKKSLGLTLTDSEQKMEDIYEEGRKRGSKTVTVKGRELAWTADNQ